MAVVIICMNIQGNRYGKLVVLEDTGNRSHKTIIWRCQCDCGNTSLVTTNALNQGNTKSCGCAQHPVKLPPGEAGFRELFRSYKRDARRRGYVFDLDAEHFRSVITQPCSYCGVELGQTKYSRGRPEFPGYTTSAFRYTGMDRVDNHLGYTVSNVVACCKICNVAKLVYSLRAFEDWLIRAHTHLTEQRMKL